MPLLLKCPTCGEEADREAWEPYLGDWYSFRITCPHCKRNHDIADPPTRLTATFTDAPIPPGRAPRTSSST